MADITHRVGIKASVSKVYAALSTIEGVGGWWTKHTSGSSRVMGCRRPMLRSRGGVDVRDNG